ncbi:MAG: hypothetical protein A3H28_00510 [Acidobacteria bacterium RIFCSPLOWO2_02_FULL_61_28]|nr:MAG: hypothetical protein A3H28_00510 [Acidobacteria bacterium RIFCSPLOWO2_02_FULL_61_28]
MRRSRFLCISLFVFVASFSSSLWAQGGGAVDERFRVLEERIRALEAEVQSLKAAVPTEGAAAAPAPAVPTPAAQAPAPEALQLPTPSLPVYGGAASLSKALNPDIGVIGNFLGATGRNQVNPFPSLSLSESEVSLQAIVDPYARADFFLAIGEEGIEVEEGYITFPALPGNFLLKGGRMRANFGKSNAFHNHSLPWIDRPLVAFNLMGGSLEEADMGIKDAGLSLSRILPAPVFLEATAELYRGDSGSLFQASRRSDVSSVFHLRGYHDLSESTNLEIGGSYARGHNDVGSDFLTHLAGLDATLRWKPLRRAIYHSFVARSEFVWSRREEEDGTQRAFGFFASAEYQFARRWFGGARFDWSERARDPNAHDNATSVVLTYWPSEFSQIRGQLRRTKYAEGNTANEFLFQFLFTLGAHGAHPF